MRTKRGNVLFPAMVCVAIASAAFWLFGRAESGVSGDLLAFVVPAMLVLTTLLILVGTIASLRPLREAAGRIDARTRTAALLIACGGVLLAAFVAPRTHRLFYDECIYQNIAQNIAYAGTAAMANEASFEGGRYHLDAWEYNKQPGGYPFIMALVYRFFGVNERYAFLLNNLAFGASIIVVFALAAILFRNPWAGISASLLFALIPQNILWANTAAAEPTAAFCASLAVVLTLFSAREKRWPSLLLASAVAAYACQFRPESVFILPVCLLALALFSPEEIGAPRLWWCGALVFLLLIPHLGHLMNVKDLAWGSDGAKFGMRHFLKNLSVNGSFYLSNRGFPVVFTVLAGCGVVLDGKTRAKALLLAWFLLLWGIFLFFYAGAYDYGVDVRFSLLSYAPLAILGGHGLAAVADRLSSFLGAVSLRNIPVRWLLVAFVLVAFIPFLPQVMTLTEEGWLSRADHAYARIFAKAMPPGSIILAHDPCIFLLHGRSAAQVSTAMQRRAHLENDLFKRFRDGVYLHWGYWCIVPDPVQNEFGNFVLAHYRCTPVMEFREKGASFKLFKVEKK